MQHPLPCRCLALTSSQWRSLSLYLASRRCYSRGATRFRPKHTDFINKNSTIPPIIFARAVAPAVILTAISSKRPIRAFSQYENNDSVKITPYLSSRKRPVREGHGSNDRLATTRYVQNRYATRRDDSMDHNGKESEDTTSDAKPVIGSLLGRIYERTVNPKVAKKVSEKILSEVKNKREERVENDRVYMYRPLLQNSRGGDMSLQHKVQLDNTRGPDARHSHGDAPHAKRKSLLDEIFLPEKPTSLAGPEKQQKYTEMPRLKLEHLIKGEEYRARIAVQSEEEKLRRFYQEEREHLGKEIGLLIMRGLGPSLEEEDFHRQSPKGKYIEGWKRELGSIQKVIPARDLDTMERNGTYYLVFESPASAMAYKEEVERRHALSKMYRPHDISSPIPPPPGYLIDGEDVHALVENFTLVPPRQKLLIMPIHEPFDDLVQSLIDHGGYRALQQGREKPARAGNQDLEPEVSRKKVLISVDGPVLPYVAIIEAIHLDGKTRGWHWNTAKEHPVMKLDFTGWRGIVPGDYKTPANNAELLKRRNRWTVEFDTESEAKRFARAWHCTRLPRKISVDDVASESPLVSAEVIW